MKSLRLFIRLARPLFLVGAALLYFLGVGIAHYLGYKIDWGLYLLGQAWVTALQLATHFLNEYYNSPADNQNPNRTPFSGGSGMLGTDKLPRRSAIFAALACLAVVASLTVLMITLKIPSSAYLVMFVAFLGAFFYSAPPIKLENSGYGELTTSLLVSYLVPAFSFILQAGELHRLVSLTALPLTIFHLAMLVALELPDYYNDVKFEKRNLLVRIGWENGIVLHNALILAAFLALLVAAILGLPWFIVWPTLITLPVGLLQIWQMRRIADGFKPSWRALTFNAVITFFLASYLMAFTYWTH